MSVDDQGDGAHHHSELAVAYLAVSVLVHRLDHILYLRQLDLGRKVLQDEFQFVRWNATFIVLAEHSESLLEIHIFLLVRFQFLREGGGKFWPLDLK